MLYRGEWQGVCSNNVLSPLITAFQVVLLENKFVWKIRSLDNLKFGEKKDLNIFENNFQSTFVSFIASAVD